jgi:hypothetical protein
VESILRGAMAAYYRSRATVAIVAAHACSEQCCPGSATAMCVGAILNGKL